MAKSGDNRVVFNQTFHKARDVYNVAGDLILKADGTREDLASAIDALKTEAAALPGLPDATAKLIQDELAAARSSASKGTKSDVTSRLENAKKVLEHSHGAVKGAVGLATTLGRVAAWAIAILT